MFSRFPLSCRLFPVDHYEGSKASQLCKQHVKMPLGWELWGTYLGKRSREGTSALEMSCSTKRMWLLWTMVMKKKWNLYKNLQIWGSYSPEWLSECDHITAQDTLFSLYWEFGLFSSPRASEGWCDMAKVGEMHLDCSRASVWPALLSICISNLLKEGESLLKDR